MSGFLWNLRWDASNLPRYFNRHGVLSLWRGSRNRNGMWSVRHASYVVHGILHLLPPRCGRWVRSNHAPPLWRELRRLVWCLWQGQNIEFGSRSVGTVTLKLRWRQVFAFWWYDQCFPYGECGDCGRDMTEDEREAYHNDCAPEADYICFECYDPTPYEPDPHGGNGAY